MIAKLLISTFPNHPASLPLHGVASGPARRASKYHCQYQEKQFGVILPHKQHAAHGDQESTITVAKSLEFTQKVLEIMSSPAVENHCPPPEQITRLSANFPACIWGDHFQTYQKVDAPTRQKHEELKEEVRLMVLHSSSLPLLQRLGLIDAIQRLGVSYHFEAEISHVLHQIHGNYDHCVGSCSNDLHTTALLFRLLRDEGFFISPDIFNKFKDERSGNFMETLESDVQGMLSLYEASFMSTHGDDILDEAEAFTTSHLKTAINEGIISSSSLLEQVKYALNRPIRKDFIRLHARHYFPIYKQDGSHIEALLNFAALDFNILLAMHQEELNQITLWWNELDLPRNIPYARNRLVEAFVWAMIVYFEPQYALARRFTTRTTLMVSIIDDTHDQYGTPEELELFSSAFESWGDIEHINALPGPMKTIFCTLLDLVGEISESIQGKPYVAQYVKQEYRNLVLNAHSIEGKWIHGGCLPPVEEYMAVALISAGITWFPILYYVGMAITTQATFDWVCTCPKICKASAIICRLLDDLAPYQHEEAYAATATKCYMKQYKLSEEEARAILKRQVKDAWKDINEGLLEQNMSSVSKPLLMVLLNHARANVLFNQDGDWYSDPYPYRDCVSSLLIDPVVV